MASTSLFTYRPKLSYARPNPQPDLTKRKALYLRGDVVSQSTGSATCELGNTKVICSVHGPRPRRQGGRGEFLDRGAVDVDVKFAPFARDFASQDAQDMVNRELSRHLESVLESSVQLHRFPKSVLDVSVVVLEDDGSSVTCATLCASYALAKAGVDMFDLVASCTVGVLSNGEFCVDPVADVTQALVATCDISCMIHSKKLTGFNLKAKDPLSYETIGQITGVGINSCLEVGEIMKNQLKQEALDELESR